MKTSEGVFRLFIADWVITLFLFITRILVIVGNLIQYLLSSRTMPTFSSIFVDTLLVVLICYIVNRRFIKASKKIFIVSQVLFIISFLAFILAVVGAYKPTL